MKSKRTIQLRGGVGSQIVTTRVVDGRKKTAADKRRKAELEEAIDNEAASEVAAMKQHKAVRPDVQKVGWK